jgi:membrane protein YdbS with pleckstrin-like domain
MSGLSIPSDPAVAGPGIDEGFERLHPNARLGWILGAVIGVSILTVIGIVAELTLTRGARNWPWPKYLPLMSLGGGAVLMVVSIFFSILAFSRCGYRLRERDLIVRSGVVWTTRRCIPRARIQHIDIKSGPISRMLGIVDVQIFVAGGMGAVAQLEGVSPQVAEDLKEALIVSRTDGV